MGRKKKINSKVLAGGFIAFIMIFSIFGVLFYGFRAPADERTNEYKGRIFKFRNNGFLTEINGEEVFFPIFPKELEDINIDDKTRQLLKQDYFVVTYDPESNLSAEMAIVQFKLFEERLKPIKKYAIRALTESSETILPQKTCADATEKNPVILLEYGNETGIYSEGNCIIAKGNSATGLYRVADRIVYTMTGVME